MNGLLEILTNKHWMVMPDFVKAARPVIQGNLNGHVALDLKDKVIGARAYFGNKIDIEERKVSAKDGTTIYSWRENANDPFISVLYVDGPITRNGGDCTYGSVEHRDMMMAAADENNCIGHIFYINTPGGSAWAKNDYQQAIAYAHERGQKVYAFVDGMCCSAGMYLAALCDERYYMHPKNQIGCIGVMAAFYTEKDGSFNKFTNENYHEIYDPESFDKNREVRDIANNNNDKLLVEELKKLGVEFRADVKAACPKATDEHLHGKVFEAIEVTGILVDGQSTMADLFTKMINEAAAAGNQAAQNAQRQTIFHNKQQTTINMKEKFPFIAALIDVEEMVCTEEGTHFDTDRLEDLNSAIEKLQAEAAKVTDLTQQLADLQASLDDTNKADDEVKDGLNATIETLNATIKTNEETIATLNEQIATLTTEAEGAKAAITTAEQTIAERDQTIADLNAQIEEMQNAPGNEPNAGAAPNTNGEGAQAAYQASNAPQWDPNKSAKENKEALDEYEQKLKAQIR